MPVRILALLLVLFPLAGCRVPSGGRTRESYQFGFVKQTMELMQSNPIQPWAGMNVHPEMDRMVVQGAFEDGAPVGEWTARKTGCVETSIGNYNNGIPHGRWRVDWGIAGVAEGRFANGLQDGEWVYTGLWCEFSGKALFDRGKLISVEMAREGDATAR